jgi:hypothetical protein
MKPIECFEIQPYVGACPILLGMTESEVISIAGEPMVKSVNKSGEKDHSYEAWSLRYSSVDERVVEIGFGPPAKAKFSGMDVFEGSDFFEKVIAVDGSPFEYYGFIVLQKLGITLTGFHDDQESQKAITVFAKGRWDDVASEFNKYPVRTNSCDQQQA